MSYQNEKRVCAAAVKWAEFMELRMDAFRWSAPERKLYDAVQRMLEARKK